MQFVVLHNTSLLQEHAAGLAVPCFHVFTACAHMTQMPYCQTKGHKCNAVRLNDTNAMLSDQMT